MLPGSGIGRNKTGGGGMLETQRNFLWKRIGNGFEVENDEFCVESV